VAVGVIARTEAELAETVDLVERAGGRARAFVADISDESAVDAAFTAIEQALGPVDLLVNNAGVVGPLGPFAEGNTADWRRTLEIDLFGQVLCAQRVLPAMIARRRGRIVNIASGGGARMLPYFSAYVTSEAALIRFPSASPTRSRCMGSPCLRWAPARCGPRWQNILAELLGGPEVAALVPRHLRRGPRAAAGAPAALLLALASGKLDRLSGRFFQPQDDLGALIAAVGEIEQRNLYTLQVDRLRPPGPPLDRSGSMR
jgi:hypothetical protein